MGNVSMVSDWKTTAVAETRNGAITFGALGLCLGASLGIVGGLARRSAAGALMGGLLGSMLGLAIGAGVSYVLLPRFIAARFDYVEYDFLISMGMHGLLWGLPGAAAGLAFAVGLGDIRRWVPSLAAGLFGAVLGAVAYEIIGATLFVTAETGKPISDAWATRLLAPLLVCVGTALAVAILLPDIPRRAPIPNPTSLRRRPAPTDRGGPRCSRYSSRPSWRRRRRTALPPISSKHPGPEVVTSESKTGLPTRTRQASCTRSTWASRRCRVRTGSIRATVLRPTRRGPAGLRRWPVRGSRGCDAVDSSVAAPWRAAWRWGSSRRILSVGTTVAGAARGVDAP